MNWFDTPPSTFLEVEEHGLADDRLMLQGPSSMSKLTGGAAALFGGGFAAQALRFSRLLPVPFRLVPIGLAAASGLVGLAGAAKVISRCRVSIERGKGIHMSWRIGPAPERELHLLNDAIETVLVRRAMWSVSIGPFYFDELDQEHPLPVFELVVLLRDGKSVPIEKFTSEESAERRRAQVARVLWPPEQKPAPETLN
jgi:hypothetical protein